MQSARRCMTGRRFFSSSSSCQTGEVRIRDLDPAQAVVRLLSLVYAYLAAIGLLAASFLYSVPWLDQLAIGVSAACWTWTLSAPWSLYTGMLAELNNAIRHHRDQAVRSESAAKVADLKKRIERDIEERRGSDTGDDG